MERNLLLGFLLMSSTQMEQQLVTRIQQLHQVSQELPIQTHQLTSQSLFLKSQSPQAQEIIPC